MSFEAIGLNRFATFQVVRALRESYPNTLVLPVLGNHDSHPADYFADPAIDMPSANKFYNGESRLLGYLLGYQGHFTVFIL
jgi:hypothetical protein